MRTYLIMVLAVLLLVSGCASQPQPTPDPAPPDGPLPKAPDFELESLDGKTLSLQDFAGEAVVLYFWTGSCPYCIEKLPELSELQETLPEDVNILLINHSDSKAKVQELVADYPNLNVFLNGDDVFARYGIRSVPTFVFINRLAEYSSGYIGSLPNDFILETINKLK